MSRLSFTRASVLSSVTVALIVAACSDDSNKDSGDNGANNTTSGTTSNTSAGPSTTGTSAGPTGAANNTTSPANSTSGNSTGSTTRGTSGGGDTTSGSSTGGTGSDTTDATTTQGTTGGGGGGNTEVDCSAAEGEIPALTLTEVASGINVPVDVAQPPGDDRMFVATLDGDVRIIKDGQVLETPFLSLGNRVVVGGAPGDERGLLGITFHPNYADNGLFYIHYSAGQGVDGAETTDTVIEEYEASSDPDVADPASARVVLIVNQPGNNNHKGGTITFGPDGFMYIGLGDGGGGGDTTGNGQNTSVLLGKILRIDPLENGDESYSTPADNLVQDVPAAAPEIWDYGLRNPFRFGFDPCDGDLYIGDVGQNMYEEITVEKAGEGHKNYGWNITEALHCYDSATCDETGITPPLVELTRQEGTSITGGAVYRGSSIPALRGAYFYADYGSNNVWHTRYDREAQSVATPTSVTQDLNVNNIVAIRNGNDGELYFVSLITDSEISASNHGEGAIYKLTAAE